MKTVLRSCVVVCGLVTASSSQAAVINVGTINAPAASSSVPIAINVTGGDTVTGVQLNAQIGDGNGAGIEPIFVSADYSTGTIFSGQPLTITGGPVVVAPSDFSGGATFTNSGTTTTANGRVVTFTISTVGVPNGDYPFLLTGGQPGNTAFVAPGGGQIAPTVINGTIHVPEPTAAAGLFAAGAAALLRRRRCRE